MNLKLIIISKFTLLVMLCITMYSSPAQYFPPVTLNIGDPAPPLRISKWLKGIPIKNFEKGSVYVVEFWATWCKPCIAAMPHLSTVARQYGDKLKILGIDVFEKNTPEEKVKKFVDSMGDRIDYFVATDKDKFMETYWVKASGDEGIPKSIIINAVGKVAWIGHPKDVEEIVPKILENKWDIQQALIERNLAKYLEALDESMSNELNEFVGYGSRRQGLTIEESEMDPGMPDSALFHIHQIVQKEPRLEYFPSIAFHTMYSLLKTDLVKAHEYGKNALLKTKYTNEQPASSIIGAIESCSDKYLLTPDIYNLGAEAYFISLSQYIYPELVNIPKYYHKMAWWYWLAKNKPKAMEAEQIAVSTLKSRDFFLPSELAVYKAQLELYKTCSVED